MESQEKYKYSQPLIPQIKDTVKKRLEAIYINSSNLADEKFKNNLFMDEDFWAQLQSEWGRGSGYKNRVADQTEDWFLSKNHNVDEDIISRSINMY